MQTSKYNTNHKKVRSDRREEILEQASLLFAEYGFKGTPLSQVSEAVGLTDPGVLHYFPNKAALLQGVLEYRDQKEIERYSEIINSEKKDIADILNSLEDLVAENEKQPEIIQLFTTLVSESIRSDHPSHDYFVNRYQIGRDTYVKQLVPFIGDKVKNEVNLNQLASLMMAVMDGLQIQWLLDPENVNLLATYKLFLRILANYLD